MVRSVLFVCLGNICRSPTAEAVMRRLAQDEGVKMRVDSAGTSDWHLGDPPYAPSVAAATNRGFDMTPLRARQISSADFEDFDLILCMDISNLGRTEQLRPEGNQTPVRLLLDGVGDQSGLPDNAVPDPFYTRDFEGTLDLIEKGCAAILRSPDYVTS